VINIDEGSRTRRNIQYDSDLLGKNMVHDTPEQIRLTIYVMIISHLAKRREARRTNEE